MDVGVSIDARKPSVTKRCAIAAEEGALDMVALADSQSMYREVYSSLALVAEHTSTPQLSVVTSNPVTRHITVSASAIATIDEISDGRAVLGMGVGDSAVRNTELTPASLSTMHDSIVGTKKLFETGETDWEGATAKLRWPETRPDVYLAGQGPRMLELGGTVADGVFNGGWTTEDETRWAVSRVREAAEDAGRDPDEVDFWIAASGEVAETHERAVDNLRHDLAATAHIISHTENDLEQIPEETADRIRQLGDEYRSDLHNQYDHPHNADLVDEYDLDEFLVENAAVAGTPSDVVDQLREFERWGVDGVLFIARVEDPEATIDHLGSHIVPEV